MSRVELHLGDCLDVLPTLDAESIDAIVSDPPYGLGFMGKAWDALPPGVDVFRECLRVLKPGGHLIAFGGTRTYHRLACAVEDAGFEIRDSIAWLYGTGFPKSLDVSKAIDKAAGETVSPDGYVPNGKNTTHGKGWGGGGDRLAGRKTDASEPITEDAKQWQGWGTALKPAHEPAVLARKPLSGTVAANVLKHGTGGLNIDGCRVGIAGGTRKGSRPEGEGRGIYGTGLHGACEILDIGAGRFPANLIHDGSDEVLAVFPETHGAGHARAGSSSPRLSYTKSPTPLAPLVRSTGDVHRFGDEGSTARFFYCAKASRADRTEEGRVNNCHPTVKPTSLMRYLVRLVTPPGGVVLDPFMGSGSTGKAAVLEGFGFVGIERDADSYETAKARIHMQPDLLVGAV